MLGLAPTLSIFWASGGRILLLDSNERVREQLKRWGKIVDDFDKNLKIARDKGVQLCPRCFSHYVIRKDEGNLRAGKRGRFHCNECNYNFQRGKLPLRTKLPDFAANTILTLVEYGLSPWDTTGCANKIFEGFNYLFKVSRGTIYNLTAESVRMFEKLEKLIIIGVLEGLSSQTLEVDDAFQHRRKEAKEIIESFHENPEIFLKENKEKNFYYTVVALNLESRYWLPFEVLEARDLKGFHNVFLKISRYLQGDPPNINCDQLKPQTRALREIFSKSKINEVERRREGKKTWKEHMELTAHVERLIRTHRKVAKKRMKFGTRLSLYYKIGLKRMSYNFLEVHKTLGKRPIENLGIPWPKNVKTWSDFIFFASYVLRRREEILLDLDLFDDPCCGKLIISIEGNLLPAPKRSETYGIDINGPPIESCIPGTFPTFSYKERNNLIKEVSRYVRFRTEYYPETDKYSAYAAFFFQPQPQCMNRLHIVMERIPAGLHDLFIPYFSTDWTVGYKVLFFPGLRIHAGKVNHYHYTLNWIDMSNFRSYINEPIMILDLLVNKIKPSDDIKLDYWTIVLPRWLNHQEKYRDHNVDRRLRNENC